MSNAQTPTNNTKALNVELGERSYPIYIGSGLLDDGELITRHIRGNSVFIISNDIVAPLYLERVSRHLNDYRLEHYILEDGEQHKNLQSWEAILSAMLRHHFDRSVTVIALGGGVVGDISGYVAASYQRGVAFIQIPTTLLSQVDSSVGGKTGVNHALGKNMIGAFHQPQCVIADADTLTTLADRELSAGLAEVIKYGLIHDAQFFAWLEQHMPALLARDPQALAKAIETSCRDKAQVVAADERESGARALLNLGHTFGHAIENAMGYGNWLHGEAVGAGMVMAAQMSARLGWLDQGSVQRCTALVAQARLPTKAPEAMNSEQFLQLMALDKKTKDGQIHLVLLKAIGKAVLTPDYDQQILSEVVSTR